MNMKKTLILIALCAAMAGPAVARERLTGEQELAKILQDRVAGKPVDCISLMNTNSTRIIDGTAIVYDTGRVIYVNKPAYPQSLDDDDVLVTKTWGSQLCRLDLVELHSRSGMWWRGSVGLEQFVPYTKVKPAPVAQ
jgi:hypothetical protein